MTYGFTNTYDRLTIEMPAALRGRGVLASSLSGRSHTRRT